MSAASEFRTNCTPEEWEAYRRGYKAGYEAGLLAQLRTDDRLAFAAIRQAVSVARYHDQRAAACRDLITEHVTNQRLKQDDYLVDVECAASNAWHHTAIATDIRHAIRTAIGTGKA